MAVYRTRGMTVDEGLAAAHDLQGHGFDVTLRLKSRQSMQPRHGYVPPQWAALEVTGPYDDKSLDELQATVAKIRELGYFCEWNGFSNIDIESSKRSRDRVAEEDQAEREVQRSVQTEARTPATPITRNPGVAAAVAANDPEAARPWVDLPPVEQVRAQADDADVLLQELPALPLEDIERAMSDNGVTGWPSTEPQHLIRWLRSEAALVVVNKATDERKQAALDALADLDLDPES